MHIILERVPPGARRALTAFGALLGAAAFALLAAGSIWIAADLWNGQEQTELLSIPLKPLRLYWCASALLIAGVFLARAVRALAGGARP